MSGCSKCGSVFDLVLCIPGGWLCTRCRNKIIGNEMSTPKEQCAVDEVVGEVRNRRALAELRRWERFVKVFADIGTETSGVIDAAGFTDEQNKRAVKMLKDCGFVVTSFEVEVTKRHRAELIHYRISFFEGFE